MIKRTILILITICFSICMNAQNNLGKLTAEGNKAFVELVDVNRNVPEAKAAINKALLGDDWNRWKLVSEKDSADFILKVSVEKKGWSLLSSSDGARVVVFAEVLNLNGISLWKSKRYQGNAKLITGYSALSDAIRKLVRKALYVEMMNAAIE